MIIEADYHTHTTFSHGKGSVEDNVRAAIARGLKEIGITDHGFGHMMFGLRRRKLPQLRREVDALNEKYGGSIRVLLGVEANIVGLDGTIDMTDELIGRFDFLLAGYHRTARTTDLGTLRHFIVSNFSRAENRAIISTKAYIRAMERYPIACITHPGSMIGLKMDMLGEAAARTGTALEISARHRLFTAAQLKRLRENGVSFLISSDAHRPEDVGDFARQIELAAEAGLDETDVLNARGCSRGMRMAGPGAR